MGRAGAILNEVQLCAGLLLVNTARHAMPTHAAQGHIEIGWVGEAYTGRCKVKFRGQTTARYWALVWS